MKTTATAIVLFLCSVAGSAQEPSLYQLTVEDVTTREGTPVTFTFREIERTPTKSIVELSALAGGSVSGPMLITKCMCGLTRARGEQFFSYRPLSSNPIRMEVTFPKAGPPPGEARDLKPSEIIFSLAHCDLLKF